MYLQEVKGMDICCITITTSFLDSNDLNDTFHKLYVMSKAQSRPCLITLNTADKRYNYMIKIVNAYIF